ncbi:MAG: secreted lipase [Acidimicrobiales bacterium]|nr:secreted lipase [Acidimicrobiales bacterium]
MRDRSRPVRSMSYRCALALGAAALLAGCLPKGGEVPVGGVATAVGNYVASPGAVAGANDWGCKPSAAHPHPVILVHATGVNLGANWVALSPMLKNAGYCVYAFNYGFTGLSLGRIGGLGDIPASAAAMASFVDRVLAATGTTKVDVVGHSQGGLMPHHYIERLGGASKVRTLVGLSPSNHGTTLLGIVTLGANLNLLGFTNSLLWGAGIPSAVQQEAGSDFQEALFGDGDTVPGPRYAVIQTRHDHVVTPYRNAFLSGPNVTNILIQDQCPFDPVGHVGMFGDQPVLLNVLNQLGPNTPGYKPPCRGYGPAL